jgi:hypothetical protein
MWQCSNVWTCNKAVTGRKGGERVVTLQTKSYEDEIWVELSWNCLALKVGISSAESQIGYF